MTTLYISGPITGLPDLNKPLFSTVADELRSCGFMTLNPHDIGEPSDQLLPWASYLRDDLIAMLLHANGLAMLPGWELSRGAQLERHVAEALGWEVRDWTDWLDPAYTVNKEIRSA